VTSAIELQYSRLPSGLAKYPRLLLTRRPEVTAVNDPPEFSARVSGVRLDAAQIAGYAQVCGFEPTAARNGDVPVTYPHVLAMPLHLCIMAQGGFPLRPMGLIHLSNSIAVPGPLEPDGALDVVVTARNYRDAGAGLAFDMDTEMTRAGAPVWRETCVFMSRWPQSAQRPGGRPERPPKAPRDSTVLAELEVTPSIAWSYARVSGDFNPIHLNGRVARFFGLRGAISHGMWSLARSLAAVPAQSHPADATLETQFLTPVQLPARVSIKEWREDGEPRRAMCDVRTGRVHMYASWSTRKAPTAASDAISGA
jgi:acyl dehydratase